MLQDLESELALLEASRARLQEKIMKAKQGEQKVVESSMIRWPDTQRPVENHKDVLRQRADRVMGYLGDQDERERVEHPPVVAASSRSSTPAFLLGGQPLGGEGNGNVQAAASVRPASPRSPTQRIAELEKLLKEREEEAARARGVVQHNESATSPTPLPSLCPFTGLPHVAAMPPPGAQFVFPPTALFHGNVQWAVANKWVAQILVVSYDQLMLCKEATSRISLTSNITEAICQQLPGGKQRILIVLPSEETDIVLEVGNDGQLLHVINSVLTHKQCGRVRNALPNEDVLASFSRSRFHSPNKADVTRGMPQAPEEIPPPSHSRMSPKRQQRTTVDAVSPQGQPTFSSYPPQPQPTQQQVNDQHPSFSPYPHVQPQAPIATSPGTHSVFGGQLKPALQPQLPFQVHHQHQHQHQQHLHQPPPQHRQPDHPQLHAHLQPQLYQHDQQQHGARAQLYQRPLYQHQHQHQHQHQQNWQLQHHQFQPQPDRQQQHQHQQQHQPQPQPDRQLHQQQHQFQPQSELQHQHLPQQGAQLQQDQYQPQDRHQRQQSSQDARQNRPQQQHQYHQYQPQPQPRAQLDQQQHQQQHQHQNQPQPGLDRQQQHQQYQYQHQPQPQARLDQQNQHQYQHRHQHQPHQPQARLDHQHQHQPQPRPRSDQQQQQHHQYQSQPQPQPQPHHDRQQQHLQHHQHQQDAQPHRPPQDQQQVLSLTPSRKTKIRHPHLYQSLPTTPAAQSVAKTEYSAPSPAAVRAEPPRAQGAKQQSTLPPPPDPPRSSKLASAWPASP